MTAQVRAACTPTPVIASVQAMSAESAVSREDANANPRPKLVGHGAASWRARSVRDLAPPLVTCQSACSYCSSFVGPHFSDRIASSCPGADATHYPMLFYGSAMYARMNLVLDALLVRCGRRIDSAVQSAFGLTVEGSVRRRVTCGRRC
jgi:hypothetical protein